MAAHPTLEPGKDDGPGVYSGPEVAGQCGHIGQSHPPDDPDESRREILQRVLSAEEPGGQDQEEEPDRNDLKDSDHRRVQEDVHRPKAEQVDPWPPGARGRGTEDERHDHEGKRDRSPRPGQIEIKW